MARDITKKLDVNDCSFAHLTLVLLLHCLVKCRSRSVAVYNNVVVNLYHTLQDELDSEYDQIKSTAEASSLDSREALLMYRRIEGTEKSVTGLTGKVESLVSQLDRMERAKSKRRETMSKLLENITEVSLQYKSSRFAVCQS